MASVLCRANFLVLFYFLYSINSCLSDKSLYFYYNNLEAHHHDVESLKLIDRPHDVTKRSSKTSPLTLSADANPSKLHPSIGSEPIPERPNYSFALNQQQVKILGNTGSESTLESLNSKSSNSHEALVPSPNPTVPSSRVQSSSAGESGKIFHSGDIPAGVKISRSSISTNNAVSGLPNGGISTTDLPPIDNDSIPKYPVTNFSEKVLNEHGIQSTTIDTHIYYNWTNYSDPKYMKEYWVDMDSHKDTKVNEMLSDSHRRAATLELSFDFPFYGHLIRNITIATGGFLYTGNFVHSWLAATQYIAPLMANFDSRISKTSFVKYLDSGSSFTVWWENVVLQDNPTEVEFSFQVTLVNNGDIIFVYKKLPFPINLIKDDFHPVKVGLSDAYIMDRNIFSIRRKTIYEYHRVSMEKAVIKNGTVIILKAQPTCLNYKDCNTCLRNDSSAMKCLWCGSISLCSMGVDRYRQQWLNKRCDKISIQQASQCAALSSETAHPSFSTENSEASPEFHSFPTSSKKDDGSMLGVLGMFFATAFVSVAVMWLLYAYRYPHSMSGQILIRYRPSQWGWRRETGYTAATIHM